MKVAFFGHILKFSIGYWYVHFASNYFKNFLHNFFEKLSSNCFGNSEISNWNLFRNFERDNKSNSQTNFKKKCEWSQEF